MIGDSIHPAERQHLYVLGHPVDHSLSPLLHSRAYDALGLNWEYGRVDCATEEEARAFIGQRAFLAINITMPYKPLALASATWKSAAAVLAQGANVLVVRDDELLCDNTDGKGCVMSLKREGVVFEGKRVIVCGTGPTSLSIAHAVAQAGAVRIDLLGRDSARARQILDGYIERAREVAVPESTELFAGDYASAHGAIERADIILDATPLGMKPGDPAPFDTTLLSSGQVVFDVVYAHGETALVDAARRAGCTVCDGYGMLVGQAVETVRDIVDWLDVPVDLDTVDLFSVMQ
jgi:shikimate dehydrogenase